MSEETYPGDTLYFLVEGEAYIAFSDRRVSMSAGDVLRVPAGIEHAVEPAHAIKLLQISFT